MGVHAFFRVFDCGRRVTLSEFKGRTIAIDAMIEIYRACLCARGIDELTDRDGNITTHIVIAMNMITQWYKAGARQIWVFDSKTPPPEKLIELAKRAQQRRRAEDDPHAGPVISDKIIADIKRILDGLSIPWLDVPNGVEAEHVAAFLTSAAGRHLAYSVLTSDSDALMFGARRIVRKTRSRESKKTQFEEYSLHDILHNYKLNTLGLIHVGVMLGCDFLPNRDKYFRGIGEKTVLAKYKSQKYDHMFDLPEVAQAVSVFTKPVKFEELKFANMTADLTPIACTDARLDALLNWLSEQSFNRYLWGKRLSGFVRP